MARKSADELLADRFSSDLTAPSPTARDVPLPPEANAPRGSAEDLPFPHHTPPPPERSVLDTAVTVGEIGLSMIGANRGGAIAQRVLPGARRRARLTARGVGAGTGNMLPETMQQVLAEDPEVIPPLLKFGEGYIGEGLGELGEMGLRRLANNPAVKGFREAVERRAGALRERVRGTLTEPFEQGSNLGPDPHVGTRARPAEDVRIAQDRLMGQGGTLLPSQIDPDMFLMPEIEGTLRGAIFGGRKIRRADAQSTEIATDLIDQFVSEAVGRSTPRQLGRAARSAVRNSREAFRAVRQRAYQYVDEIAAPLGIRVNVGALRGTARKERGGIILDKSTKKLANQILDRVGVLGTAAKRGREGRLITNEMSFEQAMELRRNLARVSRNAGKDVDKARVANNLVDQLDDQMKAAADASGNQHLIKAYDRAKKISFAEHTKYNNKVIKAILKEEQSERIFTQHLLRGAEPSRIGSIRKMVTQGIRKGEMPPDTWTKMQGGFLEDVLAGARVEGTTAGQEVLDPTKLRKQLADFGEDALRELFPGVGNGRTMLDGFRSLTRTLEIASQRSAEAAGGGLAIKIIQVTGMGTLLVAGLGGPAEKTLGISLGDNTVEAAKGAVPLATLAILGPVGLAHILTDPQMLRTLTRGLLAEAGTVAGTRAIGQLTSHLIDIEGKVEGLELNRGLTGTISDDDGATSYESHIPKTTR